MTEIPSESEKIPDEPKTEIVELSALETIERAQIDSQISTARKFPRVLSKVKADMLTFATLDEETAASCFYTLPRGGKVIQGPSIRLAEIAVSCYGNMRTGARVIDVQASGDNPHVVVQAVAHDLERNLAISIEKRRRIFKKKNKPNIDEDDINLACNACIAIAFRDAAFKVVPLALIKPVFDRAKRVAVGEVSSLVEKRGKIIDRLKQMGVMENRILAVVDCQKVEDVTIDKLEILNGLGTALKDGETTIEEAFPTAPQTELRRPLFKQADSAHPAGTTGSPPASGSAPATSAADSHPDLEAQTPPAAPPQPQEPPKRGPGRPRKVQDAPPAPTAPSEPEITPQERETMINRMQQEMLNGNVSETRLFAYAKNLPGMVHEGAASVWELKSSALAKLEKAITGLSTIPHPPA